MADGKFLIYLGLAGLLVPILWVVRSAFQYMARARAMQEARLTDLNRLHELRDPSVADVEHAGEHAENISRSLLS